jgi:hypothetical protein
MLLPSAMNAVSLALTEACIVDTTNLNLPPALKNHLIWLAFENVIEISCVAEVSHPSDAVVTVRSTDEVESAVALVQPPAMAAARLARSVSSADLIWIVSPAETEFDVIETFVWLAMLSMPVNKLFHCDACTVPPAATVEIADCPNPYASDPVPAKWLYPNGLELLLTNVLYSSSKIVSPALYAIKLFNSYHALCQCCFFVVFILDQPAQGVESGAFL